MTDDEKPGVGVNHPTVRPKNLDEKDENDEEDEDDDE